jgi:hypothetical protein
MQKITIGIVALLLLGGVYLFATSDTGQTDFDFSASDTGNSAGSESSALTSSITDVISTQTAIENAQWDDNVIISLNNDTFTYESNGLPSYGLAEKYLIPTDATQQPFSENDIDTFDVVYAADYFVETSISTEITLFPTYSSSITDTSLGQIGVVINGVALFNDYEDRDLSIVALDDQVIHDHAGFVDDCNGHSLVDGSGYHYHGVPTCVTELVDVAGEHSTMIGVLQDGFPVYGNLDTNGEVITNVDLDECSGHFDATPEFPEGIYHYHLTMDEAPYSIDCYHGEVEASAIAEQAGTPPGGGQGQGGPGGEQGASGTGGPDGNGPDMVAAAATLGVSETELQAALGGSRPPDFEGAATTLGISLADLEAAIGPPPGQ